MSHKVIRPTSTEGVFVMWQTSEEIPPGTVTSIANWPPRAGCYYTVAPIKIDDMVVEGFAIRTFTSPSQALEQP